MSKSLRRADTRASAERTADKPQREFLAKKWQRTKSRGIWILAGFLILLSIPLAAVVVPRDPFDEIDREREMLEEAQRTRDSGAATGYQSAQQRDLQRQLAEAKARDSSPEEKAEKHVAAILSAIKDSDDFELRRDAFVKATKLFEQEGGTLADLHEMGGWVRSPDFASRRVYFTYRYAGRPTGIPKPQVAHRFYFDVDTGKLFQR